MSTEKNTEKIKEQFKEKFLLLPYYLIYYNDDKLTASEWRFLSVLLSWSNTKGKRIQISDDYMSIQAAITKPSVIACRKNLSKLGYFEVKFETIPNTNIKTTTYYLNKEKLKMKK